MPPSGALRAQVTPRRFLEMADSLAQHNRYNEAKQTYLKALELSEAAENGYQASLAQHGLARIHYYNHSYDDALQWFYRHFSTVVRYKMDSLLGKAAYPIGVLYVERETGDSAAKYLDLAINAFSRMRNHRMLGMSYGVMAEWHINKKSPDSDKIEKYLNLARRHADSSQNANTQAFAAIKRYNYYFRVKKDYLKALEQINEHEKFALVSGNREAIINAFRHKAECLIMLRDTLARKYIQKWFDYKDSLFQTEKARAQTDYETLYETNKKTLELERQKIITEKEKNTRIIYLIIFVCLTMGLIALIVIILQRHRFKTEKLHREQQEAMVREVFQAEQKERIRIARDLHDSIGQKLAVIKMLLQHPSAAENVAKAAGYLDEAAAEVRAVTHNLVPEILSFGLIKGVEALADRLNSTENLTASLTVHNSLYSLQLPKQKEIAIFRILQEILANILRHSGTDKIDMSLHRINSHLTISIRDFGKGFETHALENSKGLGWRNIFARIRLLEGKIKINSKKGVGSSYLIEIPIA